MAGIDRVGFGRTTPIRRWDSPATSPGFVLPDDDIRATNIAAPITPGGPFSLQGSPADDDAPAREQATTLLFELAALQRSMLGGDPAAVLHRLEGMLAAAPGTATPPMLALLAAVRLRARVELARRTAA
jgi:hypothetical protein